MLARKREALKYLKKICGGTERKTAAIMGVSQASIRRWFETGIPVKNIDRVLKILNGKIPKEDLWPEIFCREDENNA